MKPNSPLITSGDYIFVHVWKNLHRYILCATQLQPEQPVKDVTIVKYFKLLSSKVLKSEAYINIYDQLWSYGFTVLGVEYTKTHLLQNKDV